MPCYDFSCRSCGAGSEHYLPLASSDNPPCETCGGKMVRMISRFAVVFTGPITTKYNDPKADSPHQEGHYAFAKDGKPVWIETFQQQKEFCQQNGFINPREIGPAEVSSDGKSISTRGMPGCW